MTAPARLGELRPSQMLHTYGIGSIVDLPHISAMIMGLEDWNIAACRTVVEDRLLAEVRRRLGQQVERLVLPPMPQPAPSGVAMPFDEDDLIGVPVAPFPRWVRCPACNLLARLDSGLFKLKTVPFRSELARYVHENCNKAARPPTVLPARFLVACDKGHLDDFPWHDFVHRSRSQCGGSLELVEAGVSGEASDVFVKCRVCGKSRPMSDAFGQKGRQALQRCRGRRPQLRDFSENGCGDPVKALLLGASNSWFPAKLTTLYIPAATRDELSRLVERRWSDLQKVKNAAVIQYLRDDGKLGALADYSDAELLAAIDRHRAGEAEGGEERDLKRPEWAAFAGFESRPSTDDFQLREVAIPRGFDQWLDRVVLADRLRETTALIGFTRIAPSHDFAGAEDLEVEMRAPISRTPPRFIPAGDVRGEGIFLRLREDVVSDWCSKHQDREAHYREATKKWRRRRNLDSEGGFPGIRYVLVHSMAHALMRQLSLECGYAAASVRERIYAEDEKPGRPPMAGILIYTAAPDAEGTLGGLVRMGEPDELQRHLNTALKALRLCSSDPLCADHEPEDDGATLHGAACHACLFGPETSCEWGNRYLDRGALVGTLASPYQPFFDV